MKTNKNRKLVFGFAMILAAMLGGLMNTSWAAEVIMYKNIGCECCGDWANHLRKAGYTVAEHPQEDMDAVKRKYGVTEKLASCHTAIIDGYVIEGHVPAEDISRLLSERPNIIGLSAPGMPMQSPGMQSEESKPQDFDVLSFDKKKSIKVYHRY